MSAKNKLAAALRADFDKATKEEKNMAAFAANQLVKEMQNTPLELAHEFVGLGIDKHVSTALGYSAVFRAFIEAHVIVAKTMGWTREEWLSSIEKTWDAMQVEVIQLGKKESN